MIETIILALLFAKIKKYKLIPLFKSWAIYPLLTLGIIYIILDVTVFLGNYTYTKYTNVFKSLLLLSIFILVVKYKQYTSSIIGSIFIIIGSFLNHIAITTNNGKMPVFPRLSYVTGYVKADAFTKVTDIHILGNESTKFKLLTDIFDVGYSIMSIGDIFIRIFVFIIIYNSIKHLNKVTTETLCYIGENAQFIKS